MSEEHQRQLSTREPMSWEQQERLAKAAAGSGMFGITKPEQAICLFAICQSEGLDPITALKRYHLIKGRPSMRADAMLAEFMKAGGAAIWHIRTDVLVAATFFTDKRMVNQEARQRAQERFDLLWEIESLEDGQEKINLIMRLSKTGREDEQTILRTYEDSEAKGLTKTKEQDEVTKKWIEVTKVNWQQSPRQMLTARVITEGLGIVAPWIKTGIYTPDEVEDIIQAEAVEERQFVDRATKKDSRDKVAMQKMVDEYLRQAKEPEVSPARKSELLGLAADMRCKMADLEESGMGRVIDVPSSGVTKISPPEPVDNETDEIPGLEKAARKLTKIHWRDYVLTETKSPSLRGKALGEFSYAELKVIAEKHVVPFRESKNVAKVIEADYILQALKDSAPKEKEGTPFA